jgi:hypothetical protein
LHVKKKYVNNLFSPSKYNIELKDDVYTNI